ncbi:MAG TPA: glycosyltransferase family 4 protein, partial [Methanotrichaceae archaeon]|nr:glycosyltransferase family 4 protein [Methanotrichaceae archaeon]
MRVVITTVYWKGSSGGGIKTYLTNLAKELKKRGSRVDVIFREGDDPENYKIEDSPILPLNIVKAFIALMRLKPQVIHSHGGMYYYLIAGHIYRAFHKARLVYTFHTEPPAGQKLSPLRKKFLQLLLGRCDCVTFVSKTLESKVGEIWGLQFKNSAVTYAGVEPVEVEEAAVREFRDRFNLGRNSKVLLALGLTALSYKAEGLKLLISAVKKVSLKYPDVILIATRKGKCLDELKEHARAEGIEDKIIFTGDIDSPYVPLALCDIYTHISLGEGLPIALLEAMSMGKPIIATSVGGIPEAIKDGYN